MISTYLIRHHAPHVIMMREGGVDAIVCCKLCQNYCVSLSAYVQGETGVDCGGPCPACLIGTCSDQVMNQVSRCVFDTLPRPWNSAVHACLSGFLVIQTWSTTCCRLYLLPRKDLLEGNELTPEANCFVLNGAACRQYAEGFVALVILHFVHGVNESFLPMFECIV